MQTGISVSVPFHQNTFATEPVTEDGKETGTVFAASYILTEVIIPKSSYRAATIFPSVLSPVRLTLKDMPEISMEGASGTLSSGSITLILNEN